MICKSTFIGMVMQTYRKELSGKMNFDIFIQTLATLTVLSTLMFFCSCKKNTAIVEELKRQIQEEIPIGSSSSKVLDFLDNKKIFHSEYVEGDLYDVKKSKFVRERVIYASIPDVERSFFVTYNIYLRFYFDENRNLVDFTVTKQRADP